MPDFYELNETPNYSFMEAATYLRLRPSDVQRWVSQGAIEASSGGVSFHNLLEMHILKGLRKQSGLPMQRIRTALAEYRQTERTQHPLLDPRLETDGIHLFLHEGEEYVNLNRGRQLGIPQILATYLRRIDRMETGEKLFFPFVVTEEATEPRIIQISPRIAFGRPVLAGTGISTEVIAGRFRSRDSIADLAEEYGVEPAIIEEAIRWETPQLNAA